MPALLTASAVMMCPHGGQVQAIPGATQAQAGAPILRGSDTFLVAGCTFQIAGAPNPCVSVQWLVTATKVLHAGAPVLNEASTGLCLAATQAPQGAVIIASPGQAQVQGL